MQAGRLMQSPIVSYMGVNGPVLYSELWRQWHMASGSLRSQQGGGGEPSIHPSINGLYPPRWDQRPPLIFCWLALLRRNKASRTGNDGADIPTSIARWSDKARGRRWFVAGIPCSHLANGKDRGTDGQGTKCKVIDIFSVLNQCC